MKLSTYTDTSVFDTLRDAWNPLVQRSITNTPFNTWEWNSAWWAAYHPGDLWVVTATDDEDNLLGIAPWFIEQADGKRVVRFIGHVDVTDYMDLIIDAAHKDAVFEAFANHLQEHISEYDSIGLADILEDSPTYTEFPAVLESKGFSVSFEQNDVAPLIQLPPTYDDYLKDILSSKERKETKRKMRRAEGGEYDVSWYIVDESHDLQAEMARFLELMASADTEKAAFLQNEQHVDFFNRIVPSMYENGWLQLAFVTIDGTACAAYLSFDYNDRIYVYNSGLDPENYGALAPGIVLLQYTIQHAIEHSKSIYDFLRGNEEYKYKMGGTDTAIFQLNATRN